MFYIDTDDYAASGIEVFTFPGGEPHANVPTWPMKVVHIFAKIRSWNDFGYLCCVGDALNDQGVSVNLFMPYLPGARQDRNVTKEEVEGLTPLTPRIYAKGLTWARRITACDPHSPRAVALYNNFHSAPKMAFVDQSLVVADLVKDSKYDFVLSSDEGGVERAQLVADRLGVKVHNCVKKRDFATGKLTGFRVPAVSGFGLLVDDICDGGGTFVGIREAYNDMQGCTPVSLDLYVTHGIFSKGLDVLSGFNHIYTTNSISLAIDCPGVSPRITTADLIPYYFGGMQP